MINDQRIDEMIQNGEEMNRDVTTGLRCIHVMRQMVGYPLKRAYKAMDKRIRKERPKARLFRLGWLRLKLQGMTWWSWFHPLGMVYRLGNLFLILASAALIFSWVGLTLYVGYKVIVFLFWAIGQALQAISNPSLLQPGPGFGGLS